MTITAIDIITWVFVFLFGSAIGSFLNVVIYRTPLKQSIISEPSHCFSCGNRLKWYDMFPIFSWLILRGKCRFCGARISPRYMVMEALCAVSYLGAYLVYGFSWEFAVACILFAVLIVLSGIDIDHFEIPYWCSITVAVLGIAAFFIPWGASLSLGVVAVMFVILVLVGGMGGGDLQLMLGASLLLGYRVFPALFIGIVLGAVYGIVKKIRDHRAEIELTEKIRSLATEWYQEQLDRDVGYVLAGHDDVIVGTITGGKPDIEWEFLDENAWKGLPDKSALSRVIREQITTEREGAFRITIKEDQITKVKYSRRMVFGPFLSIGIATAFLFGSQIVGWYMGLIFPNA